MKNRRYQVSFSNILTYKFQGVTDEKEETLPAYIQELIGRKFVFEINVKPFDFKARYKTFTVTRIVNECFDDQHKSLEKKVVISNLSIS